MRRKRKGRRFGPDQPQNANLRTSVFPKLFTAQHLPAPFNIKCYKDDFAFPSLSEGPRRGTVPRADQRGRGEGKKKIRFTPCQGFSSDLTSFAERNQKKPPFGVKALISHPQAARAAGLCHSRLLRLGVWGNSPSQGHSVLLHPTQSFHNTLI